MNPEPAPRAPNSPDAGRPSDPARLAGDGQKNPARPRALPLLLAAAAAAAVIGIAVFMLFPRTSPLTEAQERLARIESVRLFRKLDLIRSKVIGLALKQSSRQLFGALSVPIEQRERVSLLQKLLGQTRE